MSLSTIREMNFTVLSEADADAVGGEGNGTASPAQCAEWEALYWLAADGESCGGSPQDWLNLINAYC